MNIDLIISTEHIDKEKIKGKTVIVVDMLRATSVIITAISNGCRAVIPVLTVEEAKSIVGKKADKFILGGERRAVRIEGFQCSNSPLEYTSEMVKDKTLVITTTNGTRAIKGCEEAENILIGAIINAKAVAKKALEYNNDIVIVNAGTYGEFSIDDFICSGYIIDCIKQLNQVELSDLAFTAHNIYINNTDIKNYIKNARHYKVIENLGLHKDLEYCCKKDITDVAPEYRGGTIN
ncbi:MAG: 2-phosphosulfolactate phosphatase family protein [Bacillota bacterium]|nr:2-phosphosulfolactate phosphatase family protein [Bacillota bacterium]